MVDCSHANSNKDASRQPDVLRDVARQIGSGTREICGVMFESFLVAGRQSVSAGLPLVYGQSITDRVSGLGVNGAAAEGTGRRRARATAGQGGAGSLVRSIEDLQFAIVNHR